VSDFLIELGRALASEKTAEESSSGSTENLEPQSRISLSDVVERTLGLGAVQDATPVMTLLACLKDIDIRHLGEYELKGLSEPLQLFIVLPNELRGRLEYYHNQLSYVSSWEGLNMD
jgi:hypothetical protein